MSTSPLIIDVDAQQKSTDLQPKAIYAGDTYTDQPYIIAEGNAIHITASKTNSIDMSDKFGTTIGGILSLSMMPDQISIGGGYWRLNPLLLSCLPSTTPTPVPTLVKDTPRIVKAQSDVSSSVSGLISKSDAAQ
jgi:hypothetical protein